MPVTGTSASMECQIPLKIVRQERKIKRAEVAAQAPALAGRSGLHRKDTPVPVPQRELSVGP